MTHYLSRLRVAQNPSMDALKMLVDPAHRAQAMDAHHRLIWSAFAGDKSSPRDFLWRAEGKGGFIVLSKRKPSQSPFLEFTKEDIKNFAPDLRSGDRLRFVLRANATKVRPEKYLTEVKGKKTDRRVDIVMHALMEVAKEARAVERMGIAQTQGQQWLIGQGVKHGFDVEECVIVDYSVNALPNHSGARKGQPQFGVLDMSGLISVTDPSAFQAKLLSGFGRAKAFGCGLMLVKRA